MRATPCMIALLTGMALTYPAAATKFITGPQLDGIGYDEHTGELLPLEESFRDERSRWTTLGQALGGTPAIIALGYFHCPALCGFVRADLMQALGQAGLATPATYHLVALSIDPAETSADAASAKAADLRQFPTSGGDEGWRFLTGDAAAIARVTKSVGFHDHYDTALKQFIHPAGIVVVTPGGRISSYLLGLGYQPTDLRAAIARASAGAIAHATAPVLLFCFHFDPSTGRYTLAILRVLQLGGGMFVLTTATVLFLALRRDRQRA